MKISISYPSLKSSKGIPLLSQNRQFQWFSEPTYIYPVVPAYAASLLKQNGYDVFWDDGIAEEVSFEQWENRLFENQPDIIAIETKTPVIKKHWEIINKLKEKTEKGEWHPKIVLLGDHPTALPQESLEKSKVDFVLTGGDYDFALLSLVNHLNKGDNLEAGFWFRKANGEITNTGQPDVSKHNLDDLPLLNRELTNWKLYAYKNGNFKYTPGAYMMSGRDCWWGKCAFCSWTTLFPGNKFRKISAQKALEEVNALIKLGVKEIMDDSGTFPVGDWLKEFCEGMIERGYNKKVAMSCNMRINAIKDIKIWRLMKRAGFRFILFGLESANQKTLDRINKNLRVEEIEPGLKICKEAGLEPHITAMVGYPWESKEDARKTVNLAKSLFKMAYINTLQATIVIPYPGTPLYEYCKKNDLLLTKDYDKFDQREQVMKSGLSTEDVKELTRDLYRSFMSPNFVVRKVFSIRGFDDLKFLWRAGWKVLGHLTDFKK